MTEQIEWRNRIIESGVKPASQFMAHPNNWRTHPQRQRKALKGSLDTLGWVAPVLENRRTGYLIDGHERVWQALQNGDAQVPYIQVDLDESEEAQALLSLDAIAALAQTDAGKVDELLRAVDTGNADVQEFLTDMAKDAGLTYGDEQLDDTYTRNIQAPIYEPKGEKPKVTDLFDETRTNQLLAEIEAAELPEDEKAFLRIAARRHTVINYKRVAEYYAHSDAKTQALMENSALVIIDFNKAIELGYVKLSQEIAEQYGIDYPDD